jgi:hypothetical protein
MSLRFFREYFVPFVFLWQEKIATKPLILKDSQKASEMSQLYCFV